MIDLVDEVMNITTRLSEIYPDVPEIKLLNVATSIQNNRILSSAFMVGYGCPSALEQVAMQMGAGDSASSIKDAIYRLSEK